MFKISDYLNNILEREFKILLEEAEKEEKNKFKCYTCKWFESHESSFGVVEKCKYVKKSKRNSRMFPPISRETFEVKEKCNNYSPHDL